MSGGPIASPSSLLESLLDDVGGVDWEPTEEIKKAAEAFSNSPYKKDDVVGWFFIKDVLQARKLGNRYIIKEMPPFAMVGVHGRVRSIESTRTDKVTIRVDDGTDVIRCLFDPKADSSALAETEKMVATLREAENSADNEASLLLATNALKCQRDQTPSLFKFEDYVRICGHVREYEKTPYIYVTQGRRFELPQAEDEFKEYILQNYKEVYPKIDYL